MLTKIKQFQERVVRAASRLSDVRVIGLGLFLVLLFLIAWSGVKAINTNYGLQKQIAHLEQQNAVRRLANENFKLRNDYYNTPQYLELAARQDFGLAASGETVLIVPREVALAQTVELSPPQQAVQGAADKPFYQRNFNAWLDFLFNRREPQDN